MELSAEKLLSAGSLEVLHQFDEDMHCYLKWFLALTEIPHPSHSCAAISQKISEWCQQIGVPAFKDEIGNLYVQIPTNSSHTNLPTLAFQAHIDMVFTGSYVDGKILVKVRNEGSHKIIFSDTSSLGADDGFGVAMMLEMLEKRDTFKHPPLELIFTVDEEVGLIGAKYFKPNLFKYDYMINCDSLDGSAIYIGSAGGLVFDFNFYPQKEQIAQQTSDNFLKITIDGLAGGHSGSQIHLGRANAAKLLGKILNSLISQNIVFKINQISAGPYLNVICNSSQAVILFDSAEKIEIAKQIISNCEKQFIAEYNGKDIINVHVLPVEKQESIGDFVYSLEDSRKIAQFLQKLSNGVIRYHPDFPQTVDSSQNLGVIKTNSNGELFFSIFMRSATQSEMDKAEKEMNCLIESSGLRFEKKFWKAGSPWSPNKENSIAKMIQKSFKEVTGEEKPLALCHVTIEPSEFLAHGYSPEMAAICPSLPKAHSIGEWMNVNEAQAWIKTVYNLIAHLENQLPW